MKTVKILTCVAIMLAVAALQPASGQWSYNGTHIYNNNSGYVGIGNHVPAKLLYVGKNMTEPTAVIRNFGGGGGATFEMIDDLSGADWKFKATTVGGFKIRDNAHTLDVMTFEPTTGYVGINKADPGFRLDVDGQAQIDNSTGFSFLILDHPFNYGQSGLCFTNQGSYKAWIYYDEDDSLLRFSANNTGFADYALVVTKASNVGIGLGNPDAKLEVFQSNSNIVKLGRSNVNRNYFYNYEAVADGNGQSAIYAFRTRDSRNNGSSYTPNGTNNAIKGYDYWGDDYCFGVAGFTFANYYRCGGILGAYEYGAYWGSLGYKNSGGTGYGGYFTSYTSGTGKAGQEVLTGIGMGAWGDLFGADIHGKLYGIYAEGENYAMYSHGAMYKDNLDVHLQDNGSGKNAVMYTNVSTDVTVMTSGTTTLSSGSANISFDPSFASVVSAEVPIVVTVTPIGDCNGVHLNNVTASGFSVAENNAGKSNITVNYIAIGKRAGYENPNLPAEVVDAQYTTKLSQGLHSDADTLTNGKGLYYENGQLTVGIHPSTIPDISNRKDEEIKKQVKVVQQEGISDDQMPGAPVVK